MTDFSTILLHKILRATVEHLQESPEIDPANPGVNELKRALLEQIMKPQENHAGSQFTVREGRQVSMEFIDRVLTCVDCGERFIFSAGEQLFFSEKQFQHGPKRCKRCKAKAQNGRLRPEAVVICAECGASTIVPFVPRENRPVLCRECLDHKRQPQWHDQPACAGAA